MQVAFGNSPTSDYGLVSLAFGNRSHTREPQERHQTAPYCDAWQWKYKYRPRPLYLVHVYHRLPWLTSIVAVATRDEVLLHALANTYTAVTFPECVRCSRKLDNHNSINYRLLTGKI
jgi:uncharacterized protein YdeI (YjbR/CyaY-like superfamily)